MKHLLKILTVSLLFLIGCRCDDDVECKGLSSTSQTFIYNNIDNKSFTDGNDSVIFFKERSTSFDKSKVLECDENWLGGCDCPSCEAVSGYSTYKFDSAYAYTDSILVTLDSGSYIGGGIYIPKDSSFYRKYIQLSDDYILRITEADSIILQSSLLFFDGSSRIPLKRENNLLKFDELDLMPNMKILNEFKTPIETFNEVLEVHSLYRYYGESKYVKKFYFKIGYGVVAFVGNNNITYYLSN